MTNEQSFSKTQERTTYLDRARILTSNNGRPKHWNEIKYLTKGIARYSSKGKWSLYDYYNTVWDLRQPSFELLEDIPYLASCYRFTVSYIEFAVDIIFKTKKEANEAFQQFFYCSNQTYNRKKSLGRLIGNGFYHRALWSPSNIVAYADRPCKVNGKPCLHIELRLSGSQTIKNKFKDGIYYIEGEDIFKSLDKVLCFLEVESLEKLGKYLFKSDLKPVEDSYYYRATKSLSYAYRRRASIFLRANSEAEPDKFNEYIPFVNLRKIYLNHPEVRRALKRTKLSDYFEDSANVMYS
ncbi:MAG: hypothetical protein COA74_11050 [Gammaproteobacteria bacterium]|nr:MAG: hypothetical protein COA74_11050 [Gammaproteobacteria bacterium]